MIYRLWTKGWVYFPLAADVVGKAGQRLHIDSSWSLLVAPVVMLNRFKFHQSKFG